MSFGRQSRHKVTVAAYQEWSGSTCHNSPSHVFRRTTCGTDQPLLHELIWVGIYGRPSFPIFSITLHFLSGILDSRPARVNNIGSTSLESPREQQQRGPPKTIGNSRGCLDESIKSQITRRCICWATKCIINMDERPGTLKPHISISSTFVERSESLRMVFTPSPLTCI